MTNKCLLNVKREEDISQASKGSRAKTTPENLFVSIDLNKHIPPYISTLYVHINLHTYIHLHAYSYIHIYMYMWMYV